MSGPRPQAPRTPFFEFQARNRWATWRLGAVCALVVGGGGFLATVGCLANLVLVLFTLVFVPAVLLLGLGVLALLHPLTAWLRPPLWGIAGVFLDALALPGRLWPEDHPVVLAGLGLILPVSSWLLVRSVWLAAGVGEVLLRMGAREPSPGDLEERQLVNLVQEMAIAAGIPPPRVFLLDADVANAAVAGSGLGESHVIVGRRLLAELDRDATQGLLGHLVGSIGNGDLAGAAQIHSLLYVLELLLVVVLAPFARFPRRVARQWLAFPLHRLHDAPARRADRARALIRQLEAHRMALRDSEGAPADMPAGYFGPIGSVLVHVCPPLLALLLFGQAATGFLLLFVSVPVALLWRSRRYLADATAVALTRQPAGLARALDHLARGGAAVPGGEAVAHLFVVGPEAGGLIGSRAQIGRAFTERQGLLMGLHPPLARRLDRLARMGAAR